MPRAYGPTGWVQNQDKAVFKSATFEAASGGGVFLRMSKASNLISMEVVMLADQQACDNLRVDLSIINPNTGRLSVQLDTNTTDDICLNIKQESLAKVCEHIKEHKSFRFIISVKTHPVKDL